MPPPLLDPLHPPAPQRFLGLLWRGLRRWFQNYTFAPLWLPERWRQPWVGYLLGALMALAAVAGDLLILQFFPTFDVPGLLLLLAVLLVALTWGAGPSLVATLAGVALLDFFDIPPRFTLAKQISAIVVDDSLVILVGGIISLIAMQVQRARRTAETWAGALVAERAHSELERQRLQTVLDVLPVGVAIANARGQMQALNSAFRQLWGVEAPLPPDIAGYGAYKGWWPATGEPIAADEWALTRTLTRGEVCPGEEVEIEAFDGQRKTAINTSAPIHDEAGAIIGGVVAMVDITERKAAEQERARLLEREQAARAESEKATERLRALQFISEVALTHFTLDDLLGALLERLCQALSVENGAILLLDESGQEMTIRAVRGLEDVLAQEVRIPLGRGVAGRVAATREALIIDDLSTVETVYQYFRDRFRSFVGVPLVVDGRVIGVMHVTAVLPGRFTQDDARLLELVAVRVALAIDRARLFEAERRSHADADARASQLEAIFEALADGLMVFDAQGRAVHVNPAARRAHGPAGADLDFFRYSLTELRDLLMLRDEHGQVVPEDQLPVRRALHGELLTGEHSTEMIMRTLDGREMALNASTAPMRDAEGRISGAVIAFRDVTERRQLERRTHEALNGLLAIAQALMHAPDEPSFAEKRKAVAHPLTRQVAELTARVLGCERLGIFSLEPGTETLRPVAAVGLSSELERRWWAEEIARSAQDAGRAELFARLLEGKALVWDRTQPPVSDLPHFSGARSALAVPMLLREKLVGALVLDYGEADHMYTPPERSLAEGSAMLAALVLERERLLREREEARTSALALGEANRQMDEFLGVASHELRTPLTSILLSLQLSQRRYQRLLRDDADVTEQLAEKLEFLLDQLVRTERQASRLDRLVNDLLDVSRIRTEKLAIHRQPADLARIVSEVVGEQRQAAPDRVIKAHLPPDLRVPLLIDPDRMSQVVENYLTNALKYSAEEQPVEVGVETDAGVAIVWVRDQGPGLPAGEQALIWERFHRVPGVEVQSGSGVGLGLGLHISRTIIEAHQGQVGVQSTPGAGSTFWFMLPLPAPDNQPEAPEW